MSPSDEETDAGEESPQQTKPKPGRKKKNKVKLGAGRPLKLSTPLKRMNSSRKHKYDREKQAVNRNQSMSPQKREPPLTPETAARRKAELDGQNKLSEIRKDAALKRWDKKSSESSSDSFTFDDDGNNQPVSGSSGQTSGKGCQNLV